MQQYLAKSKSNNANFFKPSLSHKLMIKKNDFIDLEYIGKVKNGEIFDTNIKSEAEKINLEIETRPLIICLGQNMILPAIDEFLIGKEPGNYTLELPPEKAFGIRRRDLVRIMPTSIFKNSDTPPRAGMVFSFDNALGKITSVSSGRITVDFNNPIAGKPVVYELRVKRLITEMNEKAKALLFAMFRRDLDFKIEGNKLILAVEKNLAEVIKLFSEKFKEILNLELEIQVKEPKKEETQQGNQ